MMSRACPIYLSVILLTKVVGLTNALIFLDIGKRVYYATLFFSDTLDVCDAL